MQVMTLGYCFTFSDKDDISIFLQPPSLHGFQMNSFIKSRENSSRHVNLFLSFDSSTTRFSTNNLKSRTKFFQTTSSSSPYVHTPDVNVLISKQVKDFKSHGSPPPPFFSTFSVSLLPCREEIYDNKFCSSLCQCLLKL